MRIIHNKYTLLDEMVVVDPDSLILFLAGDYHDFFNRLVEKLPGVCVGNLVVDFLPDPAADNQPLCL